MKKTTLGLTLLAVFSFFLAACSNNADKKDTIDQIVKVSEQITSLQSDIHNQIDVQLKDKTEKLSFDTSLTYVKEPYGIHLVNNMELLGNKHNQDLYVTGDDLYIKANTNTWVKHTIADQVKKIKDKANTALNIRLFQAFTENKDKVKIEEKDGNLTLTITGIDDKLSAILLEQLSVAGNESQFKQLKMSNIKLVYTFDKKTKYPIKSHMTADLSMPGAGNAGLTMDGKYSKVNEIKALDLPEEVKKAQGTTSTSSSQASSEAPAEETSEASTEAPVAETEISEQ